MQVQVTYDIHVRDVAAIVYAQADPDTDLGGRRGSIGDRDEILEQLRQAIHNYGIEFHDYYADVCAPEIAWTDAEEIAVEIVPEVA
jgi:hypothetical protein